MVYEQFHRLDLNQLVNQPVTAYGQVLHYYKSTKEIVLVMCKLLGAQFRSVEPRIKGQKHPVQRNIGFFEVRKGACDVFVAHRLG